MFRVLLLTLALLLPAPRIVGQEKPPAFGQLFKSSPEEFIGKFDKNADRQLSRDEMPAFLTRGFERSDRDGNGKLNQDEVRQMLEVMRRFAGPAPKLDGIVPQLLQRMDKNMDGKIAKSEAEGRLAETFTQVDRNSDGFLDRTELTALAARFAPSGDRPMAFGGVQSMDFDALDKDANGRLSPQEAANTALGRNFSEIDSDRDGQLSRREYEAFNRKKDG